MSDRPLLSIVVLSWNQLERTRACVESLRTTTGVTYELIVVDNGSIPDVAAWVGEAADIPVLLPQNLGFAPGMNAGLHVASGTFVAFVNNDTVFPSGWAESLLETARAHRGITVPAVTAAGGAYGVLSEPGTEIVDAPPFRYLPSGVVVLTERSIIEELGGWDERYEVAFWEDRDLFFTYWTNGLSVTLDTRVLVEHVSSASVGHRPDRQEIWDRNWERFATKWSDTDSQVARLPTVDPLTFEARRIEAATVVHWMTRWHEAEQARKLGRRDIRALEAQLAVSERERSGMELPGAARLWSRIRTRVPKSVRRGLFPYLRSLYYRAFPAGRADD